MTCASYIRTCAPTRIEPQSPGHAGEGESALSLPEPLRITGHLLPAAAKALGVSYRTLVRRIGNGEVKTIPGPRCSLVPPDEMRRLLDRGGLRQRAPGAGGGPRRRDIGAPP
jgi:hypothetical protein